MTKNITRDIAEMLTADQRVALDALGAPVHFQAGERIFREGEPSRSVLVIRTGNVKVTRHNVNGKEAILAIRGADEVLGDEGALTGDPRLATVTTIAEVDALDIGADDFVAFVDEHRLWPQMYRDVVRRMRQSEERLMHAPLSVKSRLARWLLELATEVGEKTDEGWVIEWTLSQQDLATGIGATRDAVAIALRQLREQEVLRTGRQRIVVLDVERLRAAASG
ncbi:Crp/Fnr family transcriptional regulator [Kibdelosporangium aridum]|uniref:cAMP-binding domain of CRP or a regulatory subunit of cAMP-dependent protein kinases n=1 Tax=Kibdelosporangium aridum TaxID=2030 RepID=A0A1W2EL59_KIBAR|nr:Crp/Fnr family transcriptional regulator [Kibdelosporangium aridum]SMD09878.1 cAMP-binding domain of CRP or a regulatory subunit of cAMP-dependent protein kinases [Kibdelosporangium aridum]